MEGLQYLNNAEASTLDAIAERIIPTDALGPGARSAGVVTYIDRALAGFSRDLQLVYRLGLRALEEECHKGFGAAFVDLSPDAQDEVISRWLGPATPAGSSAPTHIASDGDGERAKRLTRLLSVVREHVIEGFFCDPVYGGNRATVGWRLVNFPGAQWGYTAEQMQPGYDASGIDVVTLADLRERLGDLADSESF